MLISSFSLAEFNNGKLSNSSVNKLVKLSKIDLWLDDLSSFSELIGLLRMIRLFKSFSFCIEDGMLFISLLSNSTSIRLESLSKNIFSFSNSSFMSRTPKYFRFGYAFTKLSPSLNVFLSLSPLSADIPNLGQQVEYLLSSFICFSSESLLKSAELQYEQTVELFSLE